MVPPTAGDPGSQGTHLGAQGFLLLPSEPEVTWLK